MQAADCDDRAERAISEWRRENISVRIFPWMASPESPLSRKLMIELGDQIGGNNIEAGEECSAFHQLFARRHHSRGRPQGHACRGCAPKDSDGRDAGRTEEISHRKGAANPSRNQQFPMRAPRKSRTARPRTRHSRHQPQLVAGRSCTQIPPAIDGLPHLRSEPPDSVHSAAACAAVRVSTAGRPCIKRS